MVLFCIIAFKGVGETVGVAAVATAPGSGVQNLYFKYKVFFFVHVEF